MTQEFSQTNGEEVAIIGMAGRFPGAPDLETFWSNLEQGVESITLITEERLLAAGVPLEQIRRPDYVPAAAILEEVDRFDAHFFGYTPREAERMDPQHRIFLECAWSALEHAGYAGEVGRGGQGSAAEAGDSASFRPKGPVGVFAGGKLDTYLFNLIPLFQQADTMERFQLGLGNDIGLLSMRVSFKLNLSGPSISVQTACSTSLVAIHLACQALLLENCDMALAGGVAVNVPHEVGYEFQADGILSPDGHCRAFDADARGTVFGNGAGVVVLKRLEDALRDRDTIHAVIKGTAVSNDGANKAAFTAPTIEGQARTVLEALVNANLPPETIRYVEAHGSGTSLGDPIEVRALTRAFEAFTLRRSFCGIGTVKSNIGHLDAAAGVAGLIKATLALENGVLPPTLNVRHHNPALELDQSPFYVQTERQSWPEEGISRRAAINATGFGGTNAFVVLEQAPSAPSPAPSRPWHWLAVSARTAGALEAATDRLATWLLTHPDAAPGDVAFTLLAGRRALEHRRVVVCKSPAEAADALMRRDPQWVHRAGPGTEQPRAVLVLDDLRGQPWRRGSAFYRWLTPFRSAIDACAARIEALGGEDPRPGWLSPTLSDTPVEAGGLDAVRAFVLSWSLARLWLDWGVQPEAIEGDGPGADAAACLRGERDLDETLVRLMRGASLASTSSGSSSGSELETPPVNPMQPGGDAVGSSGRLQILLGPPGVTEAPAAETTIAVLPASDNEPEELQALLEAQARTWLAGVPLDPVACFAGEHRGRVPLPTYPFQRERYWIDPLPPVTKLEGGPAREPDLARWFYAPSWQRTPLISDEDLPGCVLLLHDQEGLGAACAEALRERDVIVVEGVAGTRFERQAAHRFILRPEVRADYEALFQALADDGFSFAHAVHLGTWSSGDPRALTPVAFEEAQRRGFLSVLSLAQAFAARLPDQALNLRIVSSHLFDISGETVIDPHLATLVGPCRVIPAELPLHRCRLIDLDPAADLASLAKLLLLELAEPGGDAIVAWRGLTRWTQHFAPVRVPAPRPSPGTGPAPGSALLPPHPASGPTRDTRTIFRPNGTYLITGGLGGVGLELAGLLASRFKARLILTGRTPLPPRDRWDSYLQTHSDDRTTRKLRRLLELERQGAEVLAEGVDVADLDAMRGLLERAQASFGPVHGVIHAAGVAGGGLVQLKTPQEVDAVMAPKALGALVLVQLLEGTHPDFLLIFSSISAVLGELGQVDYCGANAFLDALAHRLSAHATYPVTAVNWDTWRDAGMAVDRPVPVELEQIRQASLAVAIGTAEGMDLIERVLAHPSPQWVVCTRPLNALSAHLEAVTRAGLEARTERFARTSHRRPALGTPFVEPRTGLEGDLATCFQEVLGVAPVGVRDNFFELGGDSLAATQLTARLRQRLHVDLPLQRVFDCPTVETLIGAITGAGGAEGEVEALVAELLELSDEALEAALRDSAGGELTPDSAHP